MTSAQNPQAADASSPRGRGRWALPGLSSHQAPQGKPASWAHCLVSTFQTRRQGDSSLSHASRRGWQQNGHGLSGDAESRESKHVHQQHLACPRFTPAFPRNSQCSTRRLGSGNEPHARLLSLDRNVLSPSPAGPRGGQPYLCLWQLS